MTPKENNVPSGGEKLNCCEKCASHPVYREDTRGPVTCENAACECHTAKAANPQTTPTTQNWEEDINQWRYTDSLKIRERTQDPGQPYILVGELTIKNFIRSLLASERAALIEFIKELRRKNSDSLADSDDYRKALGDVLTHLKERL